MDDKTKNLLTALITLAGAVLNLLASLNRNNKPKKHKK